MTDREKKPGPDPERLVVEGSTESLVKKVFRAGRPSTSWEDELGEMLEADKKAKEKNDDDS